MYKQITIKKLLLVLLGGLFIIAAGCTQDTSTPTVSPLATAVSPLPTATPPPPTAEAIQFPGKLLFHSDRSGSFNLYTYDGQSGVLMPLTQGSGTRVEGRWSADGKRIVYTSGLDDPNNFRIYMMSANGVDAEDLTGAVAGDNWAPAWAPDGATVLFQTNRDSNFEIYSVTLSDRTQVNLTNHPANDGAPVWSPNGSQIAFASQRDSNKWQLYLMAADGSNPRPILTSASNDMLPAWSKDGQSLLFASDRDNGKFHIFRVNIDGSELVQLTSGDYDDVEPVWVGDEQWIAFASNRHVYVEDPDWDIFLMKADGTAQTALAPAPGVDKRPSWSNQAP